MRSIGDRATVEPVVEENWFAEAQSLGEVEVKTTCMSRGACCAITMGRWEAARLMVWGHGPSIDEACREAVTKARPFAKHFPHPKDC